MQAPQSPSPQPSFVPLACASSRSQSSTVARGENRSSATSRPRNRKRSRARALSFQSIFAPVRSRDDGAFAAGTEAAQGCGRAGAMSVREKSSPTNRSRRLRRNSISRGESPCPGAHKRLRPPWPRPDDRPSSARHRRRPARRSAASLIGISISGLHGQRTEVDPADGPVQERRLPRSAAQVRRNRFGDQRRRSPRPPPSSSGRSSRGGGPTRCSRPPPCARPRAAPGPSPASARAPCS